MKTYCPECGTKMEYIAKKPKFCSNCGYAFAGASKPKPKPSYQDSTETEEEEIAELPQINALEFEFEADKVQQGSSSALSLEPPLPPRRETTLLLTQRSKLALRSFYLIF